MKHRPTLRWIRHHMRRTTQNIVEARRLGSEFRKGREPVRFKPATPDIPFHRIEVTGERLFTFQAR